MQRISKYSLLLQDMLQECDAAAHTAPERAELQVALEVIQFQLRHGNNLLAMDDIQECDVSVVEEKNSSTVGGQIKMGEKSAVQFN